MSADNYYVVKIHPAGGFTYVMGFASDEDPDLSVRADHPVFATLLGAIEAVQDEYAEYGFTVTEEAFEAARRAR